MRSNWLTLLRADAKALLGNSVSVPKMVAYYFRHLGFRAVLHHRIAHALFCRGFKFIAYLLATRSCSRTGADISPGASIGPGLLIHHPVGIVVGLGVVVGARCTLLQNVTIGERISDARNQYPVIGDDVIVAAGAVVIGPIKIGHQSIIGANSVVLHDIPDGVIAVGAPARIINKAGTSDRFRSQLVKVGEIGR